MPRGRPAGRGSAVMEGPHITEDRFAADRFNPDQPFLDRLPSTPGVTMAPGRDALTPYPTIGHLRARLVEVWPSYTVLQEALESQPQMRPGDHIQQGADGQWFRVVSRHTGNTFERDGALVLERERVKRYVALDRQVALRTSTEQAPTDFWNGLVWMWDGHTPTREIAIELASRATETIVDYEPASAQDQAVYRANQRRAQAKQPVIPVVVEMTAAELADASSGEDDDDGAG